MKALKPIKSNTVEWEKIENKIFHNFVQNLFRPLFKILSEKPRVYLNARSDLIDAIYRGQVFYEDGHFKGAFNSYISRELRSLGASWNKSKKAYKLAESEIPYYVQIAFSVAKARYDEKLEKVDRFLSSLNAEILTEKIKLVPNFETVLHKTEEELEKTSKDLIIMPKFSESEVKNLAEAWEENLRLDIKKFTEDEILELRQIVKENVLMGRRREELIKQFQDRYNVTENKAKFWARQETNLMMNTYKYEKYESAGVNYYRWACVKMPHQPTPNAPYLKGEVRWSHGVLEGEVFRFDSPPVTTNPKAKQQRRNNPGMDYNCRCFAIPLVDYQPYEK